MQTMHRTSRNNRQPQRQRRQNYRRQPATILRRTTRIRRSRLHNALTLLMDRRSITRSRLTHLLLTVHRNPLRNRTQRIRRHRRRRQSHRILRIENTVTIQRVTARHTSIISRSNQTLNQLSRRLLRILLLQQRRNPRHQRSSSRRPRPNHVPITRSSRNHIRTRSNHSNRNTLSRRALRNLLIPVNTAHRQHARNRRRSTNLRQAATAVTRSRNNQHALLLRIGKRLIPALRPARLIRANRHVNNLSPVVDCITHRRRDLLINTLTAGRTHIQRNRQNFRLGSHTNHTGRLTRLTRNRRIALRIVTVTGNQRSDLRAVHRLSTQALPAVLAAHARGVITTQNITLKIRVSTIHARINHSNRHALTRSLRPQGRNTVLLQPILTLTNIITIRGRRALTRSRRSLRHRSSRRRRSRSHLPFRARGRGRRRVRRPGNRRHRSPQRQKSQRGASTQSCTLTDAANSASVRTNRSAHTKYTRRTGARLRKRPAGQGHTSPTLRMEH